MMRALKIRLLFISLLIGTLIIGALTLSACGQKGPLRMPGPENTSEKNTAAENN
ncbi:MAG: lipoprotein [Pseudomonadales bacterium]|nr:lipoprotein [Pseudomonadales bacterium]